MKFVDFIGFFWVFGLGMLCGVAVLGALMWVVGP